MIILRIVKKFRQILSRHQKIRVVELGVLMVISGFMEMLSVTLILPFMDAVMEPERIMQKSYIRWVVNLLGIEKPRSFLILLALVLAAMYIIKNIFLLFQMLFQNRFVYHQLFLTQKQLLRSYLSRPYEYYLSVKSGEVLRVIGTDTTDAFAILTQILMMFSELVVSAVLMVTIFVMAPLLTVSAGAVLLVMILLIQRFSRPLLRKAGLVARKRRADMNQWMLQSIQGIKEVKLMRKESYFERNFDRAGNEYVRALYQNITLGSVPRFMIEASTMSVLFIAIALMIGNGAALKELLPVLSGIAMAAVRLLPAASRISACLASITYGEPAVDKLLENLKTVREYDSVHGEEQTENTSTDRRIGSLAKEIRMENVTYRYPSGSVDILENAGFTIRSGQSVGIVGASGAGKTTAVDVLLGLLRPQGGSVLVDGTDIRLDMTGWLSNIGYIPQAIFMLDGNIRENVAFGLAEDEIDDEQVWKALREASLDEFVRSLPDGLQTQIGERGVRLSGGQKQRIGIARALYTDPPVLVFDEATSALDHETESAIMDSIDHLHGTKTMIIIAHRLSTIDNCDSVYRVQNGSIVRER